MGRYLLLEKENSMRRKRNKCNLSRKWKETSDILLYYLLQWKKSSIP